MAMIFLWAPGALCQNASVSGQLTDAEGVSLTNLEVKVSVPAIVTRSDEQGTYRLDHLPAGSLTLQISGRGFIPQQRTVTVRDGQTAHQDFTLLQDTSTVDVVESLREYYVTETSLATRTPERLLDVPQSIQAYPNQLIEDRAILEGNDLFRNIGGVNQSTYSSVISRGFTQREILYNGAHGNPFGSLER